MNWWQRLRVRVPQTRYEAEWDLYSREWEGKVREVDEARVGDEWATPSFIAGRGAVLPAVSQAGLERPRNRRRGKVQRPSRSALREPHVPGRLRGDARAHQGATQRPAQRPPGAGGRPDAPPARPTPRWTCRLLPHLRPPRNRRPLPIPSGYSGLADRGDPPGEPSERGRMAQVGRRGAAPPRREGWARAFVFLDPAIGERLCRGVGLDPERVDQDINNREFVVVFRRPRERG